MRFLLFLAVLLLSVGGDVEAQEVPSIAVDPPSQTVAPDAGPFEVRVTVGDVTTAQGLGGYALVMSYDPAVVRALTVTDSGFLEGMESPAICPATAVDNDAGRLAHFCLLISIFEEPGPQTVEPQAIALITFEPVGEGTTALDIVETDILDPEGNTLEATTTNGEVTVGTGDQAQPTQPSADSTTEEGDAATGSDGGGNVGLYVGLGLAGVAIVGLAGAALVFRGRRRTRDR